MQKLIADINEKDMSDQRYQGIMQGLKISRDMLLRELLVNGDGNLKHQIKYNLKTDTLEEEI